MIESEARSARGAADMPGEDTLPVEDTAPVDRPPRAGRGRRRRGDVPTDGSPGGDAGLGRRRRVVALVAGGALVLTGAGVAASLVVRSPAQVAAEAKAPHQGVLTAPVEKRVLKDSVVLRGTVAAGQSVDVTVSGAAGTAGTSRSVVTKAPKPVGSKVVAGQVIAEISGRPVFALKGKVPVYRDLKSGATGDDVAQLQSALAQLGHASSPDARGTFGSGTRHALAAFYTSIGYDPVSAQTDGATAVQEAQDAVTAAERTAQDAEDARAAHATQETRRAADRADQDLQRARTRLGKAQAEAGPMLPASEVVYLSGFPARVDSVSAVLGSAVTGKVMTLSAGRLVVDGYLQEAQKGLVRTGQKAEILQEQTGKTTRAEVRSVADTPEAAEQSDDGSAASTAGGGGGEAGSGQQSATQGYRMVVAPDTPLASGAVGQDVRLTVEAASTEGEALVVPVSAVSAASDGGTVVTVVTSGGKQRRVAVRTGTNGDGYVEVRAVDGAALGEGDQVVTGIRSGSGDAG
ncbi:peptidoglycan-binding protein [Streptomyces sp. NBC_00006]|uniref:peptidoglycan-binding protein n=1 Tax=Streptomyces sp. NBC_00006 TaxID=2975619 RepID=UPI00224E973B|nr:peptidoglycan-binding protein [Streptomyces sp. NBC_00006]MCX5534280.1 peptidoglycan-binding protein [Streptomyces sp. NBC_00006]